MTAPRRRAAALLVAAFVPVLATRAARAAGRDAEPADEPWEPALAATSPPAAVAPSGFAPLADLALAAIDHYRVAIGPKSIARCPYLCTCSAFARRAIEVHGFVLGLVLFVDRFFYRENRQLVQHYEPVIGDDGRMRWSDLVDAGPAGPCP
jgi:hypothetical protein